MDFNSLRKNLRKDFSGFQKIKLAIVADWSTQMLVQAIKGYGYEIQTEYEIYEAAFDQMEAELYDADSELYKGNPDFILIFPSTQKLKSRFYKTPANEKEAFAEQECSRIESLLSAVRSNCDANVLLCNYSHENDMVLGNFSCASPDSLVYQISRLNCLFNERIYLKREAYPVDINGLVQRTGSKNVFDNRLYYLSKTIFKLDLLPDIAANISNVIRAINGRFKKCLIVDLDNTLWGGVIGDDGIENIQIGEYGIGAAFSELQWWLRQLVERGIILAVCSKNDYDKAIEPFEKHPDMVLRIEDVSVFFANWEDKASNIRKIQEILNIGFDSMVFIDDNPFERELVKKELPQITVPDLPENPIDFLSHLIGLNLFETASVSKEDKNRTNYYREEAKRAALKTNYSNLDDYLRNLEMKAAIERFDRFSVPRISQLSQRSNQFNMRTIRYSEEDIVRIMDQTERYIPLYVTLKDKLGEYGIVSVVILEILSEEKLFIDTLFMSCRVLKRGVEEFIFNSIFQLASEMGCKEILGEYIPTQKNQIVKTLFQSFGFAEEDDIWHIEVDKYVKKKTFVEKI